LRAERYNTLKNAIACLSLLSYIERLPTERDRALFGICLYTTARINEACSLHTADVYEVDGRVRSAKQFPFGVIALPSGELQLRESRRHDLSQHHQSWGNYWRGIGAIWDGLASLRVLTYFRVAGVESTFARSQQTLFYGSL
jgi:integrase